jgi:CHAT domain-containing protein
VSSTVIRDREFTESNLKNKIQETPFPIVHLATHGQFSSNLEDTFILTWDRSIKVNEFNNLLRRDEQSRSDAIELLVLSACQTAAGDKRATLGLAGISVRAGVRSTLASLWNLDDESSALLISQFYQELVGKKVTKAEALGKAQLNLLQNPRYQHPRYWAPYVLLGNWL